VWYNKEKRFSVCKGCIQTKRRQFLHAGKKEKEKELRITIPESLDYTSVFDDIFARYLNRCELVQVKTTNMGSLFKLEYRIVFREEGEEKNMIDQLRCRNGNLEILCSRAQTGREEL
jgi:hypothetical protein